MTYNWQHKDWPNFHFDSTEFEDILFQLAEGHGKIYGMSHALPPNLHRQSLIDIMVLEALATSAIEGELLNRPEVLSSVRNNLGLNPQPEKIKDLRIIGITRLMLEVRENFSRPLSERVLLNWHYILMEAYTHIQRGRWRIGPEPMQIVSGSIGREIIHFEAPPASQIPGEIKKFTSWFNLTGSKESPAYLQGPIRAAIAHLYFESIHPFEDGNGRIGRAISEKALSQGYGRPILLSLSHAIDANRDAYYSALQESQKTLDISLWIHYFLHTIKEAQEWSLQQMEFTIQKTRFFDEFGPRLNPRQEKVINRMFDSGPAGFEGGMRAKKYMAIAKTSKATATRDLQELVQLGALLPSGGGRSVHYELNLSKNNQPGIF